MKLIRYEVNEYETRTVKEFEFDNGLLLKCIGGKWYFEIEEMSLDQINEALNFIADNLGVLL